MKRLLIIIIFVGCNVEKSQKININDYDKQIEPDILIAFSDTNLFKNYKSKKKFLWSHSVQNLEKFIRKKQLISYHPHQLYLLQFQQEGLVLPYYQDGFPNLLQDKQMILLQHLYLFHLGHFDYNPPC